MKKFKLCLILLCFILQGCERKLDVFEQESIRFFPSALYYYGDPSKMMYSYAENSETTSFHFVVQLLAKDQVSIDQFKKEIHHAIITTNDGNIEASVSLYGEEKITGELGKQTACRSVKHNYSAMLDISFQSDHSITSNEVTLVYQDESTQKLDSLINIELDSISDATAMVYPFKINTIRTNETGVLQPFKINTNDITGLNHQKLTLDNINYHQNFGEATLSEDAKTITFLENDSWRTISFFCYIQEGSKAYPVYGFVRFAYFNSVLDQLT